MGGAAGGQRDKIGICSLKGLRVFEPIWTYPGMYNSTDPLRRDFYQPQTWFVMNRQVHANFRSCFAS